MQKTSVTQAKRDIEVNSDMGEAFGLHSFGNDLELMKIIDVANVACGFHAGDPDIMEETVSAAKENGVRVGAHPGLPDLTGFGRREMKLTPSEVESIILYQTGALVGFLKKAGMELNHIKPHGSLYGMLARDPELMRSAASVAALYGVPIFGLAGSAHQSVCQEMGVSFVGELYVDLNYGPVGELLIQRRPEETDPLKASERVRRALADGVVETQDGGRVSIDFDTICVHSDAKNSPDVVRAVYLALGRP
jgi:UPF0271 protein